MSLNYIGQNGIVTQNLASIIADFEAKFKNIYGPDINLLQNSPDGQWLNILAQEKKDILDLIVQYYNGLDVDRATGIMQQILYKLNGVRIKNYSYSFVYVNVTVSTPLQLQGLDNNIESAEGTGFTVSDSSGYRWILAASSNLNVGTHLLAFRAQELGSVAALPNTIQIVDTIQQGVTSVNNPASNYITGATGETEAQFRLRRNRTIQAPSQGFVDSLEAQLLSLDTVTQVKVYDNSKENVVNDMPPHSIWVIVQGGIDQEIAQTIYNNAVPGIPMKGSQIVQIIKKNGDVSNIYFDHGLATPLYVRATIHNFSVNPIDQDYIKQQLTLINYNIAEQAESALITGNIKEALGEQATVFNVEISLDNTTWVEYVTPPALNGFFVISPETITLTVE